MDKEFRFFSLGLPARLVLSGFLFALGAALELLLPGASFLGLAVAAGGWFPLMLTAASNKPDDQGFEEWRPVSAAEFDRIDDGLRKSARLRLRLGFSPSLLLTIVLLPALVILAVAAGSGGRGDLSYVALTALVLFTPFFFFGRVSAFLPQEMALKMPCFRAVLATEPPEGVVISPYLRFDKDKKGADIPEDMRLMLELKRPPEDFVGIQLQAAVNKGPNGEVPYLYAVVLTKGKKGPTYAAARALKRHGYHVEAGGEGDYGSVVIRQETGGTGYETKPGDCEELAGICYGFLGDRP
jgi:hypothetical protein